MNDDSKSTARFVRRTALIQNQTARLTLAATTLSLAVTATKAIVNVLT